MRETYFHQIDLFNDQLVEMIKLVDSAMNKATQALLDADLQLAEQVINEDAAIDSINADIEDRALELIALQGPVATDLRVLLSGMRIASSLERMGDLAVHVARAARMRYPRPAAPAELRNTIELMGQVAERIVMKTADVLSTGDIQGAIELAEMDDDMDELHRSLFFAVLSPQWDHGIEAAIDITLLSRYYERFADHAVTIGKRVIHTVTGQPYAAAGLE